MATNLALDDSLIEEAKIIGKHRTKKGVVTQLIRYYRFYDDFGQLLIPKQ